MSFPAFSVLLIIISVVLILWIIIRKTPLLAIIQLDTIAKERHLSVKKRIIESRFERIIQRVLRKITKIFSLPLKNLRDVYRRLQKKLQDIEKTIPKSASPNPQEAASQLIIARKFLDKEDPVQAEKKYIKILSADPKNIKAYLGLGEIYLKTNEFKQAQEVFGHILKIDPVRNKISNGVDSYQLEACLGLGKAFREQTKIEEAFAIYQQALSLAPNNPRILDSLIEASILLKRKDIALDYIDRLEKANPENEKIKEFRVKIKQI